MAERVTVWQCIGCGRIDGPQPCIGVCEDRKTQLVYAADYDAALAQLARARRDVASLAALASQLAHTTPHEGAFERSYRVLQSRARALLAALDDHVHAEPA